MSGSALSDGSYREEKNLFSSSSSLAGGANNCNENKCYKKCEQSVNGAQRRSIKGGSLKEVCQDRFGRVRGWKDE